MFDYNLIIILTFGALLLFCLSQYNERHSPLALLRGPPSLSALTGVSNYLQASPDRTSIITRWVETYGSVFKIKVAMGVQQVVVCDPKAVAHLHSRDAYVYVRSLGFRAIVETLIGKGVLWAEGDSHKKQRKILNPAFSNVAIRDHTRMLFDTAYKVKSAWDAILDFDETGDAMIEVQGWMNKLFLDSIGLMAFSHDFGTLDGKTSPVTKILDNFSDSRPLYALDHHILQLFIPLLAKIPSPRNMHFTELSNATEEIMEKLISSMKNGKDEVIEEYTEDTSAIGLLLQAERADPAVGINMDEIIAQMKVILLAGYDPPAITLVWALIELSRHHDIQQALRQEIWQFGNTNLTWEQLEMELPLLDATLSEVLRLHTPLNEILRQAKEDDILPLSEPIVGYNGQLVNQIQIPKGTLITIPLHYLNQRAADWGDDTRVFNPYRWLRKATNEANIPLKRYLAFSDGPRICLGKAFAIAQAKAALVVLIRHYSFELPDGPQTQIENHLALLPKPKIKGQEGAKVPLRVKRLL